MDGFVRMEDRKPSERGYYTIWRRTGPRAGLAMEARYFWNGSGWVTRGGSPTEAVVAWQDPELIEKQNLAFADKDTAYYADSDVMMPAT